MVEAARKILSDSKSARWAAVLLVSVTMFAGYFLADVMSPLQGMLESQLHWNSTSYGWYTGAYGWFNVFLFFLILGGMILDRLGARFAGLAAAMVMVAGTAVKYWAITTHALDGRAWHILFWTFPAQVWMAAFGFAVFGVGLEVTGITASKAIVRWFKGHELALAMGMQLSIARLGTAFALSASLPIARAFGRVSAPVLVCLALLCIGLLSFFTFTFRDRKLDASVAAAKAGTDATPEEAFRLKDIISIVRNRGWWYLAILCALFYSAVFPFLKYATYFMVNKFGVPESWAGAIPGLLPFGTILLTPLFGNLYDRRGKGASIMIVGSLLIILVHLLFAVPILNHWLLAVALMILLGIGFSLVPSAMWPSVPKIIPERQLGTAYAMIFWVQNAVALMAVPALIGWVLDKYCVTGKAVRDGLTVTTYSYTLPMILFMAFGLTSLVFALLLKAEDKKKGYGLQLPNIRA